ncbi:hypothetical protein [Microbacterium rhizomatis]|uniref:Uncharacterized protein n=1 Tax=Microbacterium rhizomatis TaxID=1631477 RepID=A0A5J5J390_9MICO|nr:hypothetical protein [Microbacterium rhizomatis]KAA9110506.1 hypothetical protein F6B43_02155 [Microbacterium rhizomatis]
MHTEDRETSGDALRAGYRLMRHVSPPESPWPGTLARTPDGQSCVLVDAADLGDAWRGWRAEAGGHLLAPVDVARRLDGHDVALPICRERVETFLARRGRGRDALEEGETVTLAVSLLRGAAEAARVWRDDAAVGEWWLTDAGCPVLVTDITGSTTSEILDSLAASVDDWLARAVADAATAARDPRILLRDIEECESALFAIAAPSPLATRALAPMYAREAARVRESTEPERAAAPRWADVLARHVDAEFTELVSDAAMRVWRRLRRPRTTRRRRPWLLAASLAASITVIGLVWPSGEGPATAESSPVPTTMTSAPPDVSETAQGTPELGDRAAGGESTGEMTAQTPGEGGDTIDWVTAASGLLTRRAACAGQLSCLADVIEDPARTFPAGVADKQGADIRITLLDEFGGAAVLRLEDAADPQASPQLVVVVRARERLLLRDIHAVAEKKA